MSKKKVPNIGVWEAPECFYPLYGVKTGTKGELVPEPTEALVVKALFKMNSFGLSMDQGAEILNILHIPTNEMDNQCPRKDYQKCECFTVCRKTPAWAGIKQS